MNDIMSALKYAILGLLNRKSMTGYELKKSLKQLCLSFGMPSIVKSILN